MASREYLGGQAEPPQNSPHDHVIVGRELVGQIESPRVLVLYRPNRRVLAQHRLVVDRPAFCAAIRAECAWG
jgi:hypothetical protein